jgi:hypothetical protein
MNDPQFVARVAQAEAALRDLQGRHPAATSTRSLMNAADAEDSLALATRIMRRGDEWGAREALRIAEGQIEIAQQGAPSLPHRPRDWSDAT